jgi:trimeric autotransporter adhesin
VEFVGRQRRPGQHKGLANGAAVGTVTISAQMGSIKGSATLVVTGAAVNLTSIAISPSASSIPVHTNQQFIATGVYADGSSSDLTNVVTWSSSATSIATINSNGLASSQATGTTNISASLAGITQKITLTVTAPTISSIAVTPVGLTSGIGVNQQFVATATYTDGTSSDLNSGVAWSSSSPSVVTVDGKGLATTVAAGSSMIAQPLGPSVTIAS